MGVKYEVNEGFFDTWTGGMSYVLGYIYADGSLENTPYNRGKYLRITSIDEDRIQVIKSLLESRHPITAAAPTWPNGKKCHVLRIGSHKLYDALVGKGLYPNKSLTITLPFVPKANLSNFVRGYFDGDGSVYLEQATGVRGQRIIKRLTIIFTSGSKKFLMELGITLQKQLRLKQNKIYNSRRSFQLRYGTADSIKLFQFLYRDAYPNLFMSRKFKVFESYFERRPVRVDFNVRTILGYLSHGHVVK